MRALLLAAGLGTRLRPITDSIPKCLVEINGRPLLDYWLELLCAAGITETLINLHYLPDLVLAHIKKLDYSINITATMEERLLCTGGTLLKNIDYFNSEPIMLIHADNLSLFNARSFMNMFYSRGKGIEITMMTFRTDKPETCGVVELDENGTVVAFHEKVSAPPSNLANAAVYILSPDVVDFIASLGKEVVDFSTEVLPHYMGRINTYHNDVYHRDIGTVESLLLARLEYPLVISQLQPSELSEPSR